MHNLKNYDENLIIQESGKFNFKINVISNRFENYTSFILNDNLVLIDSFLFWVFLLDGLVKNLDENDFKHLGQELDSEPLDLVKQKRFHHYECMSSLEKSNKTKSHRNEFYSSLSGKGFNKKEYQHSVKVWNKSEMKTMKDYHNLFLNNDFCC